MGNGSEASFIKIPGNIKQSLAPFITDPGNKINQPQTDSLGLKGATPQFFSFRPNKMNGKIGLLNICPSSFSKYMENDISYKLLYSRNQSDGTMEAGSSVTAKNIFDSVPTIQIREFLPDTALDQLINFVLGLLQAVDELKVAVKDKKDASATKNVKQEANKGKSESQTKTSDFAGKLYRAAVWILKYIVGGTTPNLLTSMEGTLKNNGANKYYGNGADKVKNYILNFPYVMYFRFLSCVTTNIYELPCTVGGNIVYNSSGEKGWDAGKIDLMFGPLAQSQLFKTFFGNVRVHFMKTWDAVEGSQTPNDAITVTFDLFNDTINAAINNFIFVNTLIANNKWIQYNIFEHAPALYDIKIEGYERLFACTGKFKVTGKGVMRDIPNLMAKALAKLKGSYASFSDTDIIQQKLIKIPDVYSVEMVFTSCLPDNFNTWLFKYSQNVNQIEEYQGQSYKESIVTTLLGDAIKNFAKEFKHRWPTDMWNATSEQAEAAYKQKLADDAAAAEAAEAAKKK